MGDIALNDNDIVVSQFGDLSVVISDNDDILQQVWNNILTVYGEMIEHPSLGNELYLNRVKITNDMSDIESYCENAILCDDRVDSVESITASRTDTSGLVNIAFVIITVDGDRLSSSRGISIT